MGAFGLDSTTKSTTVDTRQAASDAGIVFNVTSAKKGKSEVLAPGATSINVGGNFSADPAIVNASLASVAQTTKSFTDTLKDLFTGQSVTAKNQTQTLADVFSQSIDKISSLSESKQTDGDSERNKIVLYAVLGLLVVVGVIFIFGKR